MRQFKKALRKDRIWLLFLIALFFSVSTTAAQDKVVVIPLFGDGTAAPVPKTGQTGSYVAGDDGDLERGVKWATPRFKDNGDGTVTDNNTGLMWLKNANCIQTNYPGFDADETAGDGKVSWQHALDFVAGINAGTYPACGSSYTDWRLPNIRELHSLIDFGWISPALSNTIGTGHWADDDPFTGYTPSYYWSSTTHANNTDNAWMVHFSHGNVQNTVKSTPQCVWCVRSGN